MRIVLVLLVLPLSGCGLTGPSCLSRQERGTVAVLDGTVPAGVTTSHVVAYGAQGSQNDVEVSWVGQSSADGPRIAVYATRAGCETFTGRQASRGDVCEILGAAGWIEGHMATSLAIPNGRGNPDILGSPPQFRLWAVGDPVRSTAYTLRVTWFYGPDC